MDPATIGSTTFTLRVQGGAAVAATVAYNTTTRVATLDPTANLASNTTYEARVVGGTSGVKDLAGNPLATDFVWTFTTQAGTGTTSFLSDLAYTVTANGWGPVEKDTSNGESAAGDGLPIRIGGQTFAKGLGVHALSDVRYVMGGNCSLFTASIGVDDEVGSNGSVIFQVFGDTTLLYQSPLQTGAGSAVPISVDVSGRNTLRLVVTDGGNTVHSDHADWANAQLTCLS
jgi:hypothetical protein